MNSTTKTTIVFLSVMFTLAFTIFGAAYLPDKVYYTIAAILFSPFAYLILRGIWIVIRELVDAFW